MEMQQLGPYRLEERLGHGGMGTVHRATDPTGRWVAVKVLHPHIAHDTGSRLRVEREVSTLARVRHPRVASFLDADVDGPTPYIVTEFVPGLPLDEHVAQYGPLGGADLHRFVEGVHEALRAVHAAGVVHRDLKPGNVMVDRHGSPVIIDFGIAHIGEESRLTSTGLVMGTPGYLAPELIEGAQPTVATDWWGMGAVLAYASTGRAPFGGGPQEAVLARIRRGEHDLRAMPPEWEPLARACLAVEPGDRPTVAEVRHVVEQGGGALPGWEETVPVPVAGATSLSDAETTQQLPREATRPLPRSAASRRDAGALQPPARHRDQPAGTLRQAAPPPPPPSGEAPRREQAAPRGPVEDRPPRSRPSARAMRLHPYDPRTRLPRNPWVILSGGLALVTIGAVWPVGLLAFVTIWLLAARWSDHMAMAHLRRLMARGRRGGDGLRIAASSPWHLLTGLLRAAAGLLVPLVLGAATVAAIRLAQGQNPVRSPEVLTAGGPDAALAWAAGAAVLLLCLWWGVDSASLRRGTRLLVAGAVPTPGVGLLVAGLALLTACATGMWAHSQGWPVSLSPLA